MNVAEAMLKALASKGHSHISDEDRARWARGPWDNEPDRLQWKTRVGLPALIVRQPHGALCGYVGVPPEHPWHGKKYDEVDGLVYVHGGLTYANACSENICHVPEPGEPEDVWWFGFDCGHCYDLMPIMKVSPEEAAKMKMDYKGIPYVKEECEDLAEQLVTHTIDQT
jgi:hypothetical protein